MAEFKDREHFIPLRKQELVDHLCADLTVPVDHREAMRQFCRLLSAVFHFEYLDRLEELKNAYSPFDPDADTRALASLGPEEKTGRLGSLFANFTALMEKANFRRLTLDELKSATQQASLWGLNLSVDFDVFERLEVFARGDSTCRRKLRRMRKLWRREEIELPVYKRLVLILKLRPHPRLARDVDTATVYLKLFKDIPKLDLEMLLPGARLQMPRLQRGKLGVSFASTLGFVSWKIANEIWQVGTAWLQRSPLAFWGPVSLVFGYGYRQYFGYQQVKTTYSLMLTQSLYYLNLDNNAGVLTRLLDEAEEQESREAMLAYHVLRRDAGEQGLTSSELDDRIEHDLRRWAKLEVDFEIGDALGKLERLGLVEKREERYRALPLHKALKVLDWTWDNYFHYNAEQEPSVTLRPRCDGEQGALAP